MAKDNPANKLLTIALGSVAVMFGYNALTPNRAPHGIPAVSTTYECQKTESDLLASADRNLGQAYTLKKEIKHHTEGLWTPVAHYHRQALADLDEAVVCKDSKVAQSRINSLYLDAMLQERLYEQRTPVNDSKGILRMGNFVLVIMDETPSETTDNGKWTDHMVDVALYTKAEDGTLLKAGQTELNLAIKDHTLKSILDGM